MSATDFMPEVWVMKRPSMADVSFLVCGQRWVHGDPLPVKPDGGQPYSWLAHPVSIVLQSAPLPFIAYGARSDAEDWHRHSIAEYGLSAAAARAALSDAWRGVKDEAFNLRSRHYSISFDVEAAQKYKGGTIPRNVLAWLLWDNWNRGRITMEQRAAELTAWGRPCTAKALKRAAEERGL